MPPVWEEKLQAHQSKKEVKMPSFIVFDIIFLVLFAVVAILFLVKNKQNVKRHGIMFLYRSRFGLKFIENFAKKFAPILRPAQYLIIGLGYLLMIAVSYLLVISAWNYITSDVIARTIRAPPIAPLIPYFPRLFGLESFFPPLFFTVFIVALAIVGISHEFSHGILARLNKIRVKKTGVILLGPFIMGAFVEPDEKQMEKAPKFAQLSILAAGTFANIVMTILFGLILWGFFAATFSPAGVNFNAYPIAQINESMITFIGNQPVTSVEDIPSLLEEDTNTITVRDAVLHRITVDPGGYALSAGDFSPISAEPQIFLAPKQTLLGAAENDAVVLLIAFQNLPAVNAGVQSPIVEINGEPIKSRDDLGIELEKYEPGETITITSLDDDGERNTNEVTLADREGEPFLGIAFIDTSGGGFVGLIRAAVFKVKDPLVYYAPNVYADFTMFIYDTLWWIVFINLIVAFFNMLPVAFLDGGRFWYLTVWGITGKEKIGKWAFAFTTWAVVAILIAMMWQWLRVTIG